MGEELGEAADQLVPSEAEFGEMSTGIVVVGRTGGPDREKRNSGAFRTYNQFLLRASSLPYHYCYANCGPVFISTAPR